MRPEHRRALVEVADRLQGWSYVLGGSAMLAAHGIGVDVGDLDVVVEPEAQTVLRDAPWTALDSPAPQELFCSDWFLRTEVAGVPVDFIGGLRVRMGERVISFPIDSVGSLLVDGRVVPLADPADWYHLYRFYRPDKAEAIAGTWDPAALAASARKLGIARENG